MQAWAKAELKDGTLEINVDGVIGEDFWTGGNTLKEISAELKAFDGDQIDVHINSPGGDANQSLAVYNRLKRHSAEVNVYIDGLAASGASVIAMAGDEITMAENSMLMIHDAYTFTIGNAQELRETADVMDKLSQNVAKTYARTAGVDVEDARSWMRGETWFDADEALEAGLATSISEQPAIALCDSARDYLKKRASIPRNWTRKLTKPECNERIESMSDELPTTTDEAVAEVVESEATLEVTTEAPTEDAPTDLLGNLQHYITAFGDVGGRWFAEGKEWDACRELQLAELEANVTKLEAENTELRTKLEAAQAAGGEADPVPHNEANDGPKTFAKRIKISGRNGQN